MPLLLITYDLRAETKRPPIVSEIKAIYPSHCKICDSSYVVETNDTPDQAHGKLDHLFDSNDWRGIFRVDNRTGWQGRILKSEADWLNQRLYP